MRKTPLAPPAIAGKLALLVPFPTSTAAAHVTPPSVERRVQTCPLPFSAVAPVYIATRVVPSLASAVVEEVSKLTPVKTWVNTVRAHDVPPFVVRQVSMLIGPDACWELPG